MTKFLNDIKLEEGNDIQFKTTAGSNAGKISQTGDDLVISNAVGDVLLGNGSDDIYVGDGTNTVDIRFEQDMAIFADTGSAKTLTIGGANTTLVLDTPTFNGALTLGVTTINNKLTLTTANGYILFDYEPSGDTGEYTTETPLLKIDNNGTERTILSRVSENAAIQLGHDDSVWITAGDVGDVIKTNFNATSETVVFAAESGFYAYGFPNNDTSWANRNEFRFRSESTTASNNGLYIGDGGSTQFIDLSRNLKNIGTVTTSGHIKAMSGGNIYVYDDDDDAKIHFGASSNAAEGVLQLNNGANWGLIARGVSNSPRLGAYHDGTLDIYGFGNSQGDDHANDDLLAQFDFANERFDVNGEIRGDSLDIDGNADISGTLDVAGDITLANRFNLSDNGVMTWGNTNNYGQLNWDGDYALISGQSGKGIKFRTNGSSLALTLDTSQNATFAGDIDLPSGATLDWANGDAKIVEGETNNYSLTFKTYDGSICSSALRLDGDNTATFAGAVIIPNLPTSDPGVAGQLWNSSGDLKVSAG